MNPPFSFSVLLTINILKDFGGFITPKFEMKFFDCRKISFHQRRVSEAGHILTA
jgi:hypothetical protein